MFRPRAYRLPPALRILVTMLLALGLMLQPAMASIGEIHELAHDATGSHAQIDVSDVKARDSAGLDKEAGAAGTLHLLLDFAHCCGQSATTFPMLPFLTLQPETVLQPMALLQLPLHTRTLAPYRPPIA